MRPRDRFLRRLVPPEPWGPAPQYVVGPEEAGVDWADLSMPRAMSRLAAPPVFVTGSARSGTNFTLDVFAQHPEVCAVAETWILTQTHGVTGIFAQREWNPSVSDAAVERVGLRHAAVQLLAYEEMAHELGALVGDWLIRPVGDAQRFLVAKEPLDILATAVMFPAARFVHVLRDGRDVALSMRAASESWDPSMGVGIRMGTRAAAWRHQVQTVREHAEYLGDRYLEIRFEDLRRDVAGTARRLFEFSRIPFDDTVLERVRQGTQLSRYDESVRRSGFRGRGEAGGWRRALKASEGFGIERTAGPLLAELGYEERRVWWLALLLRGRARRRAG